MLEKRTKPVNIRVTEEEFQALHQACQQVGTRNVSELAREAMNHIVNTHKSAADPERDAVTWLIELEGRLNTLQAEVKRMQHSLSHIG